MVENLKFIVDNNVGKLAKWLRLMGYDSLLFDSSDDSRLIHIALHQERVLLTRDTEIMKRRVVTIGRLKATLLTSEEPEQQIRQVIESLNLDCQFRPFTLCLECNQPLIKRSKEEVKNQVPPYVFQTQSEFVQCPACHRIYWKGTHWESMTRRLEGFKELHQ